MSETLVKSSYGIIGTANSANNAAFTDVIGNKTDIANGTADEASIVGLLRYAIANLGQASVVGAINDAALGKNSDDSGAQSVISLLRSIVDRCGKTGGSDIYTDLAAVLVDTGTTIPGLIGTPVADISTDIAAVKAVVDKIGTVTNSGGTATIGAILGDFANTTLISKLTTIIDAQAGTSGIASWPSGAAPANNVSLAEAIRFISDALCGSVGIASFPAAAAAANDVSIAEVIRYIQESQLGSLVNTGGTATLGGILGDVANSSIAARLTAIAALHPVPTADVATNTNLRDVVGNKSDTTSGTSLVALAKIANAHLDGTTTKPSAVKREAGRTQVKVTTITSAANAGLVTLATATAQGCMVKSITLRANAAQTADLTSAAIKGGTSQVITFISAATAVRANIAATDQQVAFSGAYTISTSGTIVVDLQGTGATPVNLTATIEYIAVADGGYLA